MRRLVTLLLLRSPKFCSNFNRLEKVIEQFLTINLFDGGTIGLYCWIWTVLLPQREAKELGAAIVAMSEKLTMPVM